MAISLCSGQVMWHRDHDEPNITVSVIDLHGNVLTQKDIAVLLPGTSCTFEDDGVKITVENPCPVV